MSDESNELDVSSSSESGSESESSSDEFEEGLSLSGSVDKLEIGSEGSEGTTVRVFGLDEYTGC